MDNEFDNDSPLMDDLVPNDSRYSVASNITNYSGNLMYDIPYIPDISLGTDDEVLTTTSEYIDRLDRVANDFYQNSKYWWVVALINNINNPFDLPLDTSLRLPSLTKLIMDEVI